MKTFLRYWLFQIPGLALLAVIGYIGVQFELMPFWFAFMIVLLWFVKDILMYPVVKKSYGPSEPLATDKLIGQIGFVEKDLNPDGMIRIGHELWTASSEDRKPVEKGKAVRILSARGLKLSVSEIDELY